MIWKLSPRQYAFLCASADEVLFGGAAGGGKSYGLLIDAFVYAMRYPGSKQLMLRRSFPELEKSLIRSALGLFPDKVFSYISSKHCGRFRNGSVIDFGYCHNQEDVYQYQSAEYDTIRFDEVTHFPENTYLYLLSRLRGANPFPKQIKSATNPGGIGHQWVKQRFIDIGEANVIHDTKNGSRIFLPSYVQDNPFLLKQDPGYIKRLENLQEKEKRALLFGDWDLFDGQFFSEFQRDIHVCRPFPIPKHWRVYRALDYGMDMLACYWIAVDEAHQGYVFRELYQEGLIISQAAQAILQHSQEDAVLTLAPPDLWSRRQETGRSAADIFRENGVFLTQTSNDRMAGWMAVREWLHPRTDEFGQLKARLKIFPQCRNLIRTLPALQYDSRNLQDAAVQPHEVTHGPDALRGFCVYWTSAAKASGKKAVWSADQFEDYDRADLWEQAYLIGKWGNPF